MRLPRPMSVTDTPMIHLTALRDMAKNIDCYSRDQLRGFLQEAHDEILRQRNLVRELEREVLKWKSRR